MYIMYIMYLCTCIYKYIHILRNILNILNRPLKVPITHTLLHSATHCCTIILQHTVAPSYCNTLLHHHTATHCCTIILQHTVALPRCNTQQRRTHCDTLQHSAHSVCVLQFVAVYCSLLQSVVVKTFCNILQHTAHSVSCITQTP